MKISALEWPPIKGNRNLKNRALKNGHDVNMKSKRKGHSYNLERTRREKYNMSVFGVSREIASIICMEQS